MDERYQTAEHEINILEVLQVLVKHKMTIIVLCTFAMLASVVYSLTLPDMYSASAKVIPPQKEGGGGLSSLLGQAGGLAGLAGGGLGGGSDLYIGILKSRSLADAVISRLDLQAVFKSKSLETGRKMLASAVKCQAGKDGIISITADNTDPKVSALLANAFAEELGRMTVSLNLSKAGTERLFLEKRLDVVKKDLKAAEDDLKQFSQRNKIVSVDSQAKASIEGVARMRSQLANKEVELTVMRSQQTENSSEVLAMKAGIRRLKQSIASLAGTNGGGEVIPSAGNVPSVGLEYSRKLRELKTQEAVFEQLMKQYEMAKLTEAKDSSSLQILDQAVVPTGRSGPSRAKIVILSTAVALFLSILVVFVMNYLEKLPDEDMEHLKSLKKQLLTFR